MKEFKMTMIEAPSPGGVGACEQATVKGSLTVEEALRRENERLLTDVESWRQVLQSAITLGKLNDELREENERLREALQDIARQPEGDEDSAQAVAKAALRREEDKT